MLHVCYYCKHGWSKIIITNSLQSHLNECSTTAKLISTSQCFVLQLDQIQNLSCLQDNSSPPNVNFCVVVLVKLNVPMER